jgi:hypothetical protein
MNTSQPTKRKQELLWKFTQTCARYGLLCTSQELLTSQMIGLDAPGRKVIILRQHYNEYDSKILYLGELKRCTVIQSYKSIPAGDLEYKALDTYLETLALSFEFEDETDSELVYFYKHTTNHIHQLTELEIKARGWAGVISEFIVERKHAGLNEKHASVIQL